MTQTAIVEYDIQSVKNYLQEKWERCKQTEKYGLEFGQACYEWRKKLEQSNSQISVDEVLKDLSIPNEPVNRWLRAYMDAEGIKSLKPEKRANRSEPPDDFEVLRKLAKRMLIIGFKTMRESGKTDPSHLDAAKTWATLRIEEKESKKGAAA